MKYIRRPAGELEVGEQLDGEGGPIAITAIEHFRETVPVYNLEIHGEHVYRIGEAGVLVHNTCTDHKHHAIPNEIQRKLPPGVRSDSRVKSFTGDNKRFVPSDDHLNVVHNRNGISYKATGIRGGAYNLRFDEEIVNGMGYRNITVDEVLRIRNLLIGEFEI